MKEVTLIQIVSIFSALPPLVLGSFTLAGKNRVPRAFFIFILIGFLTDVSMFIPINMKLIRHSIYNIYCLVECLFFMWFLSRFILHKTVKRLAAYLLYLILPFWILCYFILKNAFEGEGAMSPIFDTFCLMVVSIFAAYVLLMKTQSGYQARNEAAFWFLIGIFFFSFCSFFLLAFVEDEVASQIWYLQNIINIITMILYAIGFLVAMRHEGHAREEKKPDR